MSSSYRATPTLFIDCDGILVHTTGNLNEQITKELTLLPGTLEKFVEWDRLGYRLIITTGRPASSKEETIKELKRLGLFWSQIIFDIGGGPRIVINDRKPPNAQYPEGRITAFAISPPRNHGVGDIDIETLEKQENDNLTELERQKRAWSDGAKSLN